MAPLTPPPPLGTVLLAMGDYHRDIDVVSLEDKICAPLPDLPSGESLYYGFTKQQGTQPVVCYEDQCFELISQEWVPRAGPFSSHYSGVGVQLDYDSYYISGGDAGDIAEIWESSTDTFRLLARLPAPRAGHCVTALNPTTVFIAGGSSNGGEINDFYIFDTVTQLYTEMPSMPHDHYKVACGFAETEHGLDFVVVGMYYHYFVDIYNLETGTWRTADATFPETIYDPGYVQYGDTFLVVVNESIYEYDAESETFVMRSEKLNSDKGFIFAMLMNDTNICF